MSSEEKEYWVAQLRQHLGRAKTLRAEANADPRMAEDRLRLRTWQAMHRELTIELVHGNHDRHAGIPAGLEVRPLGESHAEPPFLLCHEPPSDTGPDPPVLAGHLHPGIVLRAAGDRLRLPCFAFADRIGLLPAFGAFTGLGELPRDREWRAFPVAAGRVFEVSGQTG